jgi:hypothetical protein
VKLTKELENDKGRAANAIMKSELISQTLDSESQVIEAEGSTKRAKLMEREFRKQVNFLQQHKL